MTAYLVFFVLANPGSAAYYHAFLALLAASLQAPAADSTASAPRFHVAAPSLRGFERDDGHLPPFSLAEQIDGSRVALERCVAELCETTGPARDAESTPLRVIVVGHGVGAYIALSIVEEWRQSVAERGAAEKTPDMERLGSAFEIVGAVGLFPAVIPATLGVRLREVTIAAALRLASAISFAVCFVAHLVPPIVLAMLLRRALRLDPAIANATASLARTPWAVYQALVLARDERAAMADGRFDELICETANSPRTFLHFGLNTDDPTLDGSGRSEKKRPRPVEASALPDCFYMRQGDSAAAAALVHERVTEIVRMDLEARF